MAKIHREDMPVQHPTQTFTLPKQPEPAPAAPVSRPPQFYDQDNDTEYEDRTNKKNKKKKAKKASDFLYTIAMLVFAAIFLVSGGLLVKRFADDKKTESEFSDLQSMIDTDATPIPEEKQDDEVVSNSAKFAALKEQNADFMGWISIEGTNLDFPVMYAPDNKDYYLKHDFKNQYSIYGVPYLDEKTTLGANKQSDNLIVYGHNMKTGTIFGSLTEYKKASYYQAHPYIEFDTLYGDAKYEVFAAFAIDVVQDTSFPYNQYVDMDEDTYTQFVDEVIRRSDVDSGIRPAYGEQLLTLSTCEYSSANGRYVVVARKANS